MRTWWSRDPDGIDGDSCRQGKIETGLPSPKQLEIDCREQTAIDLGTMFDPIREVDCKPAAQRVKVDWRTRKPAACQGQRIAATNRDRLAFKAGQFCVQKRKIEFGI